MGMRPSVATGAGVGITGREVRFFVVRERFVAVFFADAAVVPAVFAAAAFFAAVTGAGFAAVAFPVLVAGFLTRR